MDKKQNQKLSLGVAFFSSNVEQDNPHWLKFSSTVGYVDKPTDATPGGGMMGYSTTIASEDLDIDSLAGSGVNVSWSEGWFGDGSENLKHHNPRFKIGVIDKAWLEGNEIKAEGHLWKTDFPEVCDTIECAKESLGASVEVYFDGIKKDDTAKTLKGLGAHFTGVALLYKNKAAFKSTKIMCEAMEDTNLDEQVKQALAAQEKANSERFEKIEALLSGLSEKLSAEPEQKAEEPKENEQLEEQKTEEPKAEAPAAMDFSALANAIVEGVSKAIKPAEQKAEEPQRKTEVNFSSVPNSNLDGEKTAMQLAEDLDKQENLTEAQRWQKKLELFQSHHDEF